jgi:SAM-dependent methyltransferase
MPPPSYRCRICGTSALSAFAAREMMYGTRESFDYFECPGCGCVQIADIPSDLARFYPQNYYSFQRTASSLRRRLKLAAFRALVAAGSIAPPLRATLSRRSLRLARLFLYEEATQRNHNAAILDVGAGGGDLVKDLADLGYRRALGIDPFLPQPVHYRDRVLVAPLDLAQVADRYDVISFHHSLEHMPDQRAVLTRAREVLAPGGSLIVRIPIVGGEAWETYRAHWAQLDPPRHLYLHSAKSFALVAAQAGLKIIKLDFDSTGFQFWGSELFRRDIPLNDPRSPAAGGAPAIFTAAELSDFEVKARALNQAARGDQIVAWLAAA